MPHSAMQNHSGSPLRIPVQPHAETIQPHTGKLPPKGRTVGGLEKFNYFTFGRPVMILTDHKPLIAISKKSLVSAPPRLQHLLLRLANYNVELQCIPGKEMIFSDHLSHNVIAGDSSNKPTCEGLDLKIHEVVP